MTPGPIRVVICDDHQVVADGLAALLAMEPGIEVVDVTNSMAEAVASAREQRPDVVLMDYGLPDGNTWIGDSSTCDDIKAAVDHCSRLAQRIGVLAARQYRGFEHSRTIDRRERVSRIRADH